MKILNLIQELYKEHACQVIRERNSTGAFKVRSGV